MRVGEDPLETVSTPPEREREREGESTRERESVFVSVEMDTSQMKKERISK